MPKWETQLIELAEELRSKMHTDNQVNELASDFNQLGQNTHPIAKKFTAEYNDDEKRPLNDNSKPLDILTN